MRVHFYVMHNIDDILNPHGADPPSGIGQEQLVCILLLILKYLIAADTEKKKKIKVCIEFNY